MKIKSILLLTILFGIPSLLFAQAASRANGSYYNLEKYWFYRYRLINDFMKLGPNCGESLPFAERIMHRDNPFYTPGVGNSIYTFNTGGEVPIHLGDYIAALATEYKMLSNNGLNTERTTYELELALNAFERIDKNAEAYTYDFVESKSYESCFPQNEKSNMLNGYFIRDDIPYRSFMTDNLTHFNRPGSLTKLLNKAPESAALYRYENIKHGIIYTGVTTEPSDWYRFGWKNICVPHEESKDGTVNLSMGFALTNKMLGGFSHPLADKAGANLKRMITYINDASKIGSPGWPHSPWSIINPITKKCVFGDEWGNNPCDGGGLFLECTYGAANASQKWGHNTSGLLFEAQDLHQIWQGSQWFNNTRDHNFWGTYAALSQNWYLIPIGAWWPKPFGSIIPPGAINVTWRRMKEFAIQDNEGMPFLPYLYRVMRPGAGKYFMSEETKIKLDEAPPCGTHNYYGHWSNRMTESGVFQADGVYAQHWSGPNLLHSYYSREGFPGKHPTKEHKDFNGIDYLVLFNLFSLQEDFYLLWMFNSYYRQDFNLNFPDRVGTPAETGSNARKLKLNFLEYVSAINKVEPNGYFTMRCGKAIDLKPGFEAKTGSRFMAYVEDYSISCGWHDGTPSEEYHYAEINEQAGWFPFGVLPQGQGDTSFYLNFPPDGIPYVADSAAMTDPDPDAADTISCETAKANFDSLVANIYESGDLEQIAFIDSIIPTISFPECDSTGGGPTVTMRKTNGGAVEQSTNFNIYPNPGTGRFTFAFSDLGNYDIKVFNALGAVVYQTHVYSRRSEVVYIDNMPNGVYTAEVVNSSGPPNKQIRKLIISH